MRFFLISFFLFSFLFTKAEIVLEGIITDNKINAASGINVLVYLPGSKTLIAFAVSDEKGYYKTDVKSPSDSLDIELSSIQYEKKQQRIENKTQVLDFILKTDVKQLEGITIKASPIIQKGDTLSYLVTSFTEKEDRSIEDVLKKMPGIEVEADGQILYQGLPLQKFYVEGMDLMDGKYSVISKNLPHESVSTVEVLENHQPIKLLEEKVESAKASLNLKLKKKLTYTGTAKLGLGLSPLIRDINITPMIFSKKLQFLASYQTNNTGNDVASQMRVLSVEDVIHNLNLNNTSTDLLSIYNPAKPSIEEDRYLDNNIHLFNLNALFKMNNDVNLRANLYYINDHQDQVAIQKRSLFTPNDTLLFNEKVDNRIQKSYLSAEITLNKNVKQNYLNNKFDIKLNWDEYKGLIINDIEDIRQNLSKPISSFSNNFKSIYNVGKNLIQLQSYISYNNKDHELLVSPGQFEYFLNNSESYSGLIQHLDHQSFLADHSAVYYFNWNKLLFSTRIGFGYAKDDLQTELWKNTDDGLSQVGEEFSNKITQHHYHYYLSTDVEYKTSRFTFSARLPLSFQKLNYENTIDFSSEENSKLFFDPNININYKLSNFWKFWLSYNLSNKIGNIDQIQQNYILKNYKDLSKNNVPMLETKSQFYTGRISYKNPLNSLFHSFSYVYSTNKNNFTLEQQIQDDGTFILGANPNESTIFSHYVASQSSKYFSALKSTFRIKIKFNQSKSNTVINDSPLQIKTHLISFAPAINVKLARWLNAEYELESFKIKTIADKEELSSLSNIKNKITFLVFPASSHLLSINGEYYQNNGKDFYFADLSYRYSISKPKIDFECKWSNIFGTETYLTYKASEITVWESEYILRPAQILCSLKFRF